jgi:L-fuconolactonase
MSFIKKYVVRVGVLVLFAVSFSACQTDSTSSEPVPIIDCHVHLWDTTRPEGISWPRPEHKKIYRPYLPEHISPIAKKNNVRGIVAMQSGQTTGDNQWNLDIIEKDPLFKGVMGNLSKVIGTDEFKPLLDKLCKNKKYLGYRLSGKYQEGLSKELFRDLNLTAERGLAVDFLVGGYSFEDIATIAVKVPKLRIMLDHIGGVSLDGKPLKKDWVKELVAMGKYKNVYCKVSALFGRFKEQPAPKGLESYREVLDLALDTFGEDRLVYSSDWPVSEQTGDYTSVVDLTKSYFLPKGKEISRKVFFSNALKFYRVPGVQ